MGEIRRKIGIILLAAAAVALSRGSALATGYTFTDLTTAMGVYAVGGGSINNNGDVVGSARFSDSTPYHAYLWRNGNATDLSSLGGQSGASYITDSGMIVGGAYADPSVNNMYNQAVIYSLGSGPINIHNTMTYNANNSGAAGVGYYNGNTYIVGQAYNDKVTVMHAVRWTYDATNPTNTAGTAIDMNPTKASGATFDSSFSGLRKMNSSGQMVGFAAPTDIGYARATLWDSPNDRNPTYLQTDGWQSTYAIDINNSGQILVNLYNGVNKSSGIWDGTNLRMIPNPEGRESFLASAMNNLGQVVGTGLTQQTTNGSGDNHAFLWQDDGTANGTLIDLGSLLQGWYLVSALDINDKGQIVVGANQSGFDKGATTYLVLTPTPTPIPAALPLFASGFLGLIGARRRFFRG
jgi:probable HAF family extracellular repeat protein